MNLKDEIFALLDSLNVEHNTQQGIVFAKTPEGDIWTFTEPLWEFSKAKSDERQKAIIEALNKFG